MSEIPLYCPVGMPGVRQLWSGKDPGLTIFVCPNRMRQGREVTYRGTSLIRKRIFLGPYRRPMPRVLGES